jgi:molecular chaperone DnaK (HSP70)
LITDWPNPAASITNSEKVPTVIAYKNGKPNSWGFSTAFTEQSFRWFKILLDPSSEMKNKAEPVVASSKLLAPLNKTAEDVAADYLRLLWAYFQEHIRMREGENWAAKYELRAVLTVPAIWTDKAKAITLRIAKAAGLPRNVSLVSEPEAAALAVLRDRGESDHNLKVCLS